MLISVQYARALAALLVVCAHLRGFAAFGPLDVGEFGGMGVDIFFVISGFIMWETSRDQSPGDFARRRISRIVPAYWFYTTLLIVLALVLPSVTPNVKLDAAAVIKSYLFIPYTNHNGQTNPILLQGWTLNYEMFFYAIFGLSLFIRNRLVQMWAIIGFFIACAVAGLFFGQSVTAIAFYTSTMPLEFVFGILVSVAAKIQVRPGVRAGALLIGLAGLLAGSVFEPADTPRFIALGLPSAFLLFGLLGMEQMIRKHPVRWLTRIGDASYSLYLLHPFVLSGVAVAVKILTARIPALGGLPGAVLFAATSIAASCLLAYLSFLLLEKPAGRLVNSLFPGQWPRIPAPVSRPANQAIQPAKSSEERV